MNCKTPDGRVFTVADMPEAEIHACLAEISDGLLLCSSGITLEDVRERLLIELVARRIEA